jgi:hypothetical protein
MSSTSWDVSCIIEDHVLFHIFEVYKLNITLDPKEHLRQKAKLL